jgi:hypothetical protein
MPCGAHMYILFETEVRSPRPLGGLASNHAQNSEDLQGSGQTSIFKRLVNMETTVVNTRWIVVVSVLITLFRRALTLSLSWTCIFAPDSNLKMGFYISMENASYVLQLITCCDTCHLQSLACDTVLLTNLVLKQSRSCYQT